MGQQLRAHNVHVENLGLRFHVRQFTTACNSSASEHVATVWSLRVLHSHAQTHIYILIIKTRNKKLFLKKEEQKHKYPVTIHLKKVLGLLSALEDTVTRTQSSSPVKGVSHCSISRLSCFLNCPPSTENKSTPHYLPSNSVWL